MTDVEAQILRAENAYLKTGWAELPSEATDLDVQLVSLQQPLEGFDVRCSTTPANPLEAGR